MTNRKSDEHIIPTVPKVEIVTKCDIQLFVK